jgi:hypothetical protein
MIKYLLSRKQVDEAVLEWERYYNNGTQTESLPMFIRKNQAVKMLQDIIEFGITPETCEELIKKLNG